jgi:hypothetical protein
MSWGNESPDMDQLTMKKFQELCEHLIKLREKKDEVEEFLKNGNIEIKNCESQILKYMEEFGMPQVKGEFGTISIKKNKSVSQPQTPEDKEAFFDYLREQGIFEDMVSVNSRTLSSWASKEIEAKEKEGVFGWTPPGLNPPTEFKSLSVRKNG